MGSSRSVRGALVGAAVGFALTSSCARGERAGSAVRPAVSPMHVVVAPAPKVPEAPACIACGEPKTLAILREPALVEMSGIVASATHPGIYYVHNDSGDTPRFFAVDEDGRDQGTFHVRGAHAIDWEDIARGPCADAAKSCVYLGDIGDNDSVRKSAAIYRVPEPETIGAGDHELAPETFPFVYPDGAHDAETLLVHPTTGEVTIVTKGFRGSAAYTFPMPLEAGKVVTLTKVGALEVPELLPLVTGGDVRPDGRALLLRTYGFVYFYVIPEGASLAQAVLGKPCRLPSPDEPQGEGIGWLRSGKGFVTVSEGENQPLHEVLCP